MSVETTLQERGSRYGKFEGHADVAQNLKAVIYQNPDYIKLNNSQRESLDMIFHKVGRIINGDPNYADSWHDIAGYATLVEKQLTGVSL